MFLLCSQTVAYIKINLMPKLLQINVALNKGSTGRISEQIGKLARSKGWDTFILHGARYVNTSVLTRKMTDIAALCAELLLRINIKTVFALFVSLLATVTI